MNNLKNTNLSILAYRADAVISFLKQTDTVQTWNRIYENCEFATVFQSYKFVLSWYEIYKNNYEPLLLIAEQKGEIIGFFPLCIIPAKRVSSAGLEQAEYHSWISLDNIKLEFFFLSITWLRYSFPGFEIHFKYLPSTIPFFQIAKHFNKNINFHAEKYKQPLIQLDKIDFSLELKKKNRREKINRLKKLGEFKFVKVEDYFQFEKDIDSLIIQNDFRKGAMYGKEYFKIDSNKREFMLKLFEENLLHLSYLEVSGEVISVNASVFGKKVLHLQGFNAHSPFHSKYSPGILHFLYLGMEIKKGGYEIFDLTPGGIGGYKWDLANNQTEVFEVYFTSFPNKISLFTKKYLKNFYFWFDSKLSFPILSKLKILFVSFYKKNILSIFKIYRNVKLNEFSNSNYYYKLAISSKNDIPSLIVVFKHNSIEDLMLYSDVGQNISRQEYLSFSLKRLEFGYQVYTFANKDGLETSIWFIPKGNRIDHPYARNSPFNFIYPIFHQRGDFSLEKILSITSFFCINNNSLADSSDFVIILDKIIAPILPNEVFEKTASKLGFDPFKSTK